MSIFNDQARFMRARGQTTGVLNLEQAKLYVRLCIEGFREFGEAHGAEDQIKQLIDCLAVLVGLGQSMGWNLQGAWDEVYRSNMSKVNPETGIVEKREDGKVLKGAGYIPACMKEFI